MTKLPAEAYAIIEGRHSDPFHYLGLHSRRRPERRARVPAGSLQRRGDRRAWRTAPLERIHDAGLFAGALPNGSTRYQLRARFGDNVVELDDPYRFPPVLSDFDLYLLGEGTHQRIYDKLGAHPMTLDGVEGVAFVVLAPNARGVSVVGDFNFWNRAAASDAGARRRLLGAVHPACPRRRPLQVRHHRTQRPASAAEIRSGGLCRGSSPQDRLDRLRPGKTAASAPGAGRHECAERADVDLRGSSRLMAAQGQQ